MNAERKKQLLEEYKNRRPEMGIISFRCNATGEAFLGISSDTRADFNSTRCKLASGGYPNKRLQELWNQYREAGFELSVLKLLKYDDPASDHTKALEEMRDKCLSEDVLAKKLWK